MISEPMSALVNMPTSTSRNQACCHCCLAACSSTPPEPCCSVALYHQVCAPLHCIAACREKQEKASRRRGGLAAFQRPRAPARASAAYLEASDEDEFDEVGLDETAEVRPCTTGMSCNTMA